MDRVGSRVRGVAIIGEAAVAGVFAAAIWTDGLTAISAKWALTGVDPAFFVIAAMLTWVLDRR